MSDEEFLRLFESQEISLDDWDHRAHLRLAYLYLNRYSYDEALDRIRSGIQAHNAARGIEDTPTSGYHETLTQVWLRLVFVTLRQFGPSATAEAFLDEQAQLTQKRVPLLFYSRDRMMSAEAKAGFVEPDLATLPAPLKQAP